MTDWPELTLKADMPIMTGGDLDLRRRRGERLVIVKSVPLAMFDGMSERQSERNHQQTLARIRERGGFDAGEVVAVLSGQSWDVLGSVTEEAWHRILYAMVVQHNRGKRVAETALRSNTEE